MARTSQNVLREPGVDRHIVQLYRDRAFRARAVAEWVREPLERGGGAILVGLPEDAPPILSRLVEDGVDVAAVREEGRLLVIDGREYLSGFMRDGQPVASLLKSIVHEAVRAVRAAALPGAEVRAWGEMVDVLRKMDNPEGARRLEVLWNEIIDAEDIRLLCSYGVDHLDPAAHASALQDACAGHSVLIAEEDGSALDAAVSSALMEVYGERMAPLVRAELSASRVFATKMAPSEALLIRAHQKDARIGARLLASVRRHLDARTP